MAQAEKPRYYTVLQPERAARGGRGAFLLRGAPGHVNQSSRGHCALARRNPDIGREREATRGNACSSLRWGMYPRWVVSQSVRLHSLSLQGARTGKAVSGRGKTALGQRASCLLRTNRARAGGRKDAPDPPQLRFGVEGIGS